MHNFSPCQILSNFWDCKGTTAPCLRKFCIWWAKYVHFQVFVVSLLFVLPSFLSSLPFFFLFLFSLPFFPKFYGEGGVPSAPPYPRLKRVTDGLLNAMRWYVHFVQFSGEAFFCFIIRCRYEIWQIWWQIKMYHFTFKFSMQNFKIISN